MLDLKKLGLLACVSVAIECTLGKSIFLHLYCTCYCNYLAIVGINMPPIVKRKGRPRGHELTSIGLPAKKRRRDGKKPTRFLMLHTSEKERGTYAWVCTTQTVEPHSSKEQRMLGPD
jgi:hypothetical protein